MYVRTHTLSPACTRVHGKTDLLSHTHNTITAKICNHTRARSRRNMRINVRASTRSREMPLESQNGCCLQLLYTHIHVHTYTRTHIHTYTHTHTHTHTQCMVHERALRLTSGRRDGAPAAGFLDGENSMRPSASMLRRARAADRWGC